MGLDRVVGLDGLDGFFGGGWGVWGDWGGLAAGVDGVVFSRTKLSGMPELNPSLDHAAGCW